MPPRIYYRNVLTSPGALLIPSSQERSSPRAALLRPGLSDVLRFARGWDIRPGENDRLQIEEQDPDPPNAWQTITANLSAGQYGTPTLVGSEVGLKLSAVAGAFNGYGVTYAGSKFTIARAFGIANFRLPFATCALFARSFHPDLGFADADVAGLTSYQAGSQAFLSRRSVNADLGAPQPFRCCIAYLPNLSAVGRARLDAATATLVGRSLRETAPDFTVQLQPIGKGFYGAFFQDQTYRFVRLVLDDTTNAAGQLDVGHWYVGSSFSLTGVAVGVVDERVGLSQVHFALGGAHHQVRRPTARVWRVTVHRMTDADKDELDAFLETVRLGGSFFFDLAGDGLDIRYAHLADDFTFQSVESEPVTWRGQLTIRENVG